MWQERFALKINMAFWNNATEKRKRIYLPIIIFIFSIIILVVGSSITLSSDDAYKISDQLNKTLSERQENNTLTNFIFLNNFSICLLMFIPIVGAGLGLFVLFETGLALSAIAFTQGFPTWLALASLVVTPVFWLEFTAYSIAMAQSIWLFRRLFQLSQPNRRQIILRELKWTGAFVGLCAGLLIVGAVIEVWLINFASSIP